MVPLHELREPGDRVTFSSGNRLRTVAEYFRQQLPRRLGVKSVRVSVTRPDNSDMVTVELLEVGLLIGKVVDGRPTR